MLSNAELALQATLKGRRTRLGRRLKNDSACAQAQCRKPSRNWEY